MAQCEKSKQDKGQDDNQISKKSVFKGVLSKRAKAYRQRIKESDAWWHRDISFNHALILSSSKDKLIENLFEELYEGEKVYERDQKIQNLNVLIANLIKQTKRPLRVPLNEKKWKKSPYRRTNRSMPKLVHKLNERGYIEMKKGNEIINRETRITATKKLLSLCEQFPESVIWDPVELVELKTFQGRYKNKPSKEHPNKVPIPVYELAEYEDTNQTKRIRKVLEKANLVNNNALILHGNKKISVPLVAIFIENFSMYGRLHTRGFYHLQQLKEKERSELTINGQPVIELDFSALHPNLLYAANGIQWPLDKDCYSEVDNHPFVRPFLKTILLTMLNTESFNKAQAAANYWFRTEKIKDENGRIIGSHRKRLKSIGIHKAGPLIEKMEKVHEPISNFFYKKAGLKLMNKDAAIALDIVDHFAMKNIPILPVHDSFIVEEKHGNELRKIMHETYSKHTGGYKIKVK